MGVFGFVVALLGRRFLFCFFVFVFAFVCLVFLFFVLFLTEASRLVCPRHHGDSGMNVHLIVPRMFVFCLNFSPSMLFENTSSVIL